ncbi:MAG TPA: glycosyltransferase [Casimicrobiaceae bacterium]|nr:glycosyltransferase [Casimicrobiaceae bacterium]
MTALSPPASRNARCPCGSGRRFKDCHGALGAEAGPDAELRLALQAALAARAAGRGREALQCYRRALEIDAECLEALHMSGVVHYELGEHEQAIGWIRRAIARRPDLPMLRRNLRVAEFAVRERGRAAEYREWVERFDSPPPATIALWRDDAARQADPARISIVMPTYNSPDRWLRACLDSVLAQTWPHWQLCVADDASTLPSTRATLDEYARRDARIEVELRSENGGIAAASNTALARVTGSYVALLDHDDELAPWALQFMAQAIAGNPDVVLLYSDEDKIDEQGRRYEPYFKPDWDPVLLTAQNYISHLGVYRADALRSLGGFRLGYDGAQDWDLVLRLTETADRQRIVHVPRVLYHWRAVEGSTARAMRNKDYAERAQQRAVVAHLDRTGVKATIVRAANDAFLQTDPVPTGGSPPLCIVFLQRGTRGGDDAEARWREWVRAAGHDAVFISADEAAAPMTSIDDAPPRVDRRAARLVNAAVAATSAAIIVMIDDGLAPLTADWIDFLVRHAAQPPAGAVGGLLYDAEQCAVHAGYTLDPQRVVASPYFGYPREWLNGMLRGCVVQCLSAVGFACMAVRKRVWDEVGGLDAETLIAHYRDADFCLRLEDAGYRNRWHPGVQLAYPLSLDSPRSAPPTGDAERADRDVMQRRWGRRLAADRAYNPNLAAAPRLFELNAFDDPSRGFDPLSNARTSRER